MILVLHDGLGAIQPARAARRRTGGARRPESAPFPFRALRGYGGQSWRELADYSEPNDGAYRDVHQVMLLPSRPDTVSMTTGVDREHLRRRRHRARKARRRIRQSAAFGLGFVLGQHSALCSARSIRVCRFGQAAGLRLLNAMYGLFVLPESPPRDRRAAFTWRHANPIGSIALLRSNIELLGLSVVNFIGYVAHEALPTTFVLYAMYRYHWNARRMGFAIGTVGVCSALVGAGMVPRLVAKFGERRVMLAGVCSMP